MKDTPPSNFIGSADVGVPQDVSVEAENLHTNGQGAFDAATNYTGISSAGQGGNPDWGQTATTLYAPTVKYNLGGRTTDLVIVNASSASTTVYASYYNSDGSFNQSAPPCSLAPNARCVLTLPGPSGALLSAIVTAGQPLAGVVFEYDSAQSQVNSYNLLTGSVTTWYVPTVKKDSTVRSPQSTGILIQNTNAVISRIVWQLNGLIRWMETQPNNQARGPGILPNKPACNVRSVLSKQAYA